MLALKLIVLSAATYAAGAFVRDNSAVTTARSSDTSATKYAATAAPWAAAIIVGGGIGYVMFRKHGAKAAA